MEVRALAAAYADKRISWDALGAEDQAAVATYAALKVAGADSMSTGTTILVTVLLFFVALIALAWRARVVGPLIKGRPGLAEIH